MKLPTGYTHTYSKDYSTSFITTPEGYAATIITDEYPFNPLAQGDCEPLAAVYDGEGRLYNPAKPEDRSSPDLDVHMVLRFATAKLLDPALPAARRRRNKRRILDATPHTAAELAMVMREEQQDFTEALHTLLAEEAPSLRSWTEQKERFETMACLATLAELGHYQTVSRGHSQGDAIVIMALATPEWAELVGAPKETHNDQCKSTVEQYTNYCWGDVYRIETITRPDGTEMDQDDIDAYSIYGDDYATNGAMDIITSAVANDLAYLAREAQAQHDAACRDIVTV